MVENHIQIDPEVDSLDRPQTPFGHQAQRERVTAHEISDESPQRCELCL
jgi:hypothetical protein